MASGQDLPRVDLCVHKSSCSTVLILPHTNIAADRVLRTSGKPAPVIGRAPGRQDVTQKYHHSVGRGGSPAGMGLKGLEVPSYAPSVPCLPQRASKLTFLGQFAGDRVLSSSRAEHSGRLHGRVTQARISTKFLAVRVSPSQCLGGCCP